MRISVRGLVPLLPTMKRWVIRDRPIRHSLVRNESLMDPARSPAPLLPTAKGTDHKDVLPDTPLQMQWLVSKLTDRKRKKPDPASNSPISFLLHPLSASMTGPRHHARGPISLTQAGHSVISQNADKRKAPEIRKDFRGLIWVRE